MANFLSNMIGGVENFFGRKPQQPQQPKPPQQPLPQPSFNVANLKANVNSVRQQALPQVQQPKPVVTQPVQPKPVAPPPQIQAGGRAPLPAPTNTLSPFLNNMVHGALQVPQGATATHHDAQGNVLGWDDAQGTHLTQLGQQHVQAPTRTNGQNLITKIGNIILPNTEKFANTVAAGASGVGSLTKVAAGAITHNPTAEANALAQADAGMNKYLAPGHGIGGEGGAFKSAQEAQTATPADIARKSVATGTGVASEVAPFFIGGGAGVAAKTGEGFMKAGAKTIATGAGVSAATDATSQIADKKQFDPAEVFKSAVMGGATAGLVHGATEGAKALTPGIKSIAGKTAQAVKDELSHHLSGDGEWSQAISNHFHGNTTQQVALDHLASTPEDANNALNHTAANIISAIPGIAENHAAAAAIRKNPALGLVLKHAITGDEVNMEHALREVLPGAPDDVIQAAKTHLMGEEKPLQTAPTPEAAQLQEQKAAEDGANQQAQQAAADQQTKAAETAAAEPRPVTPQEVEALAAHKKTTDVYSTIKQANPGISHKEATQIAHDVTKIDDPVQVAAYLNEKGILTDNSHEIAADAAKPAAVDNASTEAALGQGAETTGTQAEDANITQNNQVYDRNHPSVSAKIQEMIKSGERKTIIDEIKHANPGISSLDASRLFTQHVADQMTADAAKHPLDKTAENIVAGQRAKGHTAVTDALIADKKAAGTPLTPEEQAHDEAMTMAAHNTSIADKEKAAAAQAALANPTTGKLAPNTTALRILSDENVPEDTKSAITNLYHEVHNQKVMEENAKTLVESDAKAAQDIFDSRSLNPDSHIKLGNALTEKYNAEGNTDAAQAVYDDMINTTKVGGQTLRAAQGISKISPQGIAKYAENLAGKAGKQLDPAIKAQLVEAAKQIAKMDAGEEKATAVKNLLKMAENKSLTDKAGDYLSGVLSIPRALMATGDLSFGGRQGAILGALHPVQWVRANMQGARMAADSKYFDQRMSEVANMTDKNGESLNPVFKKMGVDLMGIAHQHEETYGNTSILESDTAKKLGIGHVVAGSDRAYTGAATVLRSGVIKDFVDKMGGVKGLENWTEKDYKDFGRVINTATGRGQGGDTIAGKAFERAAPTLGQTLFSARLWKSRLDLLNPVYYARLAPAARAEALKSSAAFAGVVGVTLAAAKASGASVETDPRSSDFGKIKIGNTRYDVMGGLQQNIVLATRELTGEKKKSDGTIEKLDGGFGHASRTSVLKDFVDNKTTPVINTAFQLGSGKDMGGNPVNPWTTVAKLFIPLGAQDVNSLVQDNAGNQNGTQSVKQAAQNYMQAGKVGKSVAMSLPGFGGAGVQTYPSSTSPQPGTGVDPSTLSPKDLTKYEKNVTAGFTKSLSPNDQKIYALLGSKDAATFALRKGTVTQAQLDDMQTRENKAKDKAGLPLNYVEGITDAQYKASDPEMQAVIKQASLQGQSKFAKAPINADSQKLIEEASKNAWPGIGDIKPTNQMALDYVKMQKSIADKPGDQAAAYGAQRTFWKSVVKTQYSDPVAQMYEDGNSDTTNQTSSGYGMSTKDIQRLASGVNLNGKSYKLTGTDLSKMMELDNRLLTSGLIDSPKFSNKVRASLGYGNAPGVGDGSIGYHAPASDSSSTNMHSSDYVTDFGSSAGGASPFLTQSSKPAAAPKVDLSKFKAGSSTQKKITINL